MDNILVYSNNLEEYINYITKVLKYLLNYSSYININ